MNLHKRTLSGLPDSQRGILEACFDILGIQPEERDEVILKTYLLAKERLLCLTKKVTSQIILETCASICQVTEEDIKTKKPKGDAHASKLIYYRLASRYTLANQESIANTVNVSRTAYVLGLQKADDQYDNNKTFRILYDLCETRLLNQIQ